MVRKSVKRFSEKTMPKQEADIRQLDPMRVRQDISAAGPKPTWRDVGPGTQGAVLINAWRPL